MKKNSSLQEWLSLLEKQSSERVIKLGLERINDCASLLGLLPYSVPVITVAGTNGKGSTVALIESILIAHGYRVGSFTSPHLFTFSERIKINAIQVDEKTIVNAFEQVDTLVNANSLTYFEWVTLAALLIFNQQALDFVILEVGLGGRLDAVNIVDPLVSVITSIGLDHQQYLGNTREEIAFEKAGIFREKGKAVCGCLSPPDTLLKRAADLKSSLDCQNRDFEVREEETMWHYHSDTLNFTDLPKPRLALQNAATAIKTLTLLPITLSMAPLKKGLLDAYLPGRCEWQAGPINRLFDVAHNEESTLLLIERLKSIDAPIYAVFGMFRDKQVRVCVKLLAPYIKKWFVSPLDSDRSLSQKELQAIFNSQQIIDVRYFGSICEANDQANNEAIDGDTLLVTGSFLAVGKTFNSRYTGLPS